MFHEVYSALLAFITVIIIGPTSIKILKALKFRQSIRKDGPTTHLKKAGTPTMGGIMILIGASLATFFLAPKTLNISWALFITLGFGAIGLTDDFIIAVFRRSLGLKARYKLAFQILLSILLGLYAATSPSLGTIVSIPFSSVEIDLGIFGYLVFAVFIMLAISNAVNLSDGLDGLASGTTALAYVAYSIVAIFFGKHDLAVFSSSFAGACIGFSWFNCHPAEIMMGDTGSLALGAALGSLAILTKTELLLIIIGGVFVLEALSVIIQVIYFKLTGGKRIFRMSPVHHHFELSGWKEPKIVTRFWILGLVFSILGLLALLKFQ
ncbi:MAG: phospho-N-acetylmuramoyl-pentapeptide-transferase [Firmicutes bacterium]|jgi:phospho-N-acetylmuramoyl-pentapeptide-transferase|nr:phospho-N-acetylmuramoyl-pentapeptide-transferase [Bacillota bacterium]